MLGSFMTILDSTIANLALPYMQGSLNATIDQVAWVLTSYIIATAIMTAPMGWLATRFGWSKFPTPQWFIDDVAKLGFPLPVLFAWLAVLAEVVGDGKPAGPKPALPALLRRRPAPELGGYGSTCSRDPDRTLATPAAWQLQTLRLQGRESPAAPSRNDKQQKTPHFCGVSGPSKRS